MKLQFWKPWSAVHEQNECLRHNLFTRRYSNCHLYSVLAGIFQIFQNMKANQSKDDLQAAHSENPMQSQSTAARCWSSRPSSNPGAAVPRLKSTKYSPPLLVEGPAGSSWGRVVPGTADGVLRLRGGLLGSIVGGSTWQWGRGRTGPGLVRGGFKERRGIEAMKRLDNLPWHPHVTYLFQICTVL